MDSIRLPKAVWSECRLTGRSKRCGSWSPTPDAVSPHRAAPGTRAHEGAIRPMLDYRLFGVRELTPRRFGWTVLFVALFTLWSTIPNVVAVDGLRPSAATLAKYLPEFSAGYTLWMVPAMIAVSIADNLPLEGIRRTLALTAALALAALISVS